MTECETIYNTPIGTHYIEGVTKKRVNAKQTHNAHTANICACPEKICFLAKSSKTLLARHQRVDEH